MRHVTNPTVICRSSDSQLLRMLGLCPLQIWELLTLGLVTRGNQLHLLEEGKPCSHWSWTCVCAWVELGISVCAASSVQLSVWPCAQSLGSGGFRHTQSSSLCLRLSLQGPRGMQLVAVESTFCGV